MRTIARIQKPWSPIRRLAVRFVTKAHTEDHLKNLTRDVTVRSAVIVVRPATVELGLTPTGSFASFAVDQIAE